MTKLEELKVAADTAYGNSLAAAAAYYASNAAYYAYNAAYQAELKKTKDNNK